MERYTTRRAIVRTILKPKIERGNKDQPDTNERGIEEEEEKVKKDSTYTMYKTRAKLSVL